MNSVLAAALDYVSRGWPLLPVYPIRDGRCACRRGDCQHPGKHPIGALVPHGLHGAAVDAGIVEGWLRSWRDANIAIATGWQAGVWVLDIDPRHGGDNSLHDLEREHGPLPDSVRVLTGGGGTHIYFRTRDENIGCMTGIRAGIDVKGVKGFVLVPPSNHASGGTYRWELGAEPGAVAVAEAPAWLVVILRSRRAALRGCDGGALLLREGERNAGLFRIAASLRRHGIGDAAIGSSLAAINRLHVVPPLSASEIAAIARSAGRYAPAGARAWRFRRVPKP